jgi:mono/diheme cytochrome c family protein
MRILLPVLALSAMLAAAACGTVATPEWAAEAQETRVAQAATSDHLTAIAPTFTPSPAPTETPIPPTATPLPPTATPVPPTATPVPPTETPVPTEVPTEAPTEEAAAVEIPADLAAQVAAADPVNGQVVFTTQHDNTDRQPGSCSACHWITPDEMRIIGPGLWNVSERAGSRVPGEDALTYIYQSIVAPDAFIAPGDPAYQPGVMPHNWAEVLTPQEIYDVMAYLMTLHD